MTASSQLQIQQVEQIARENFDDVLDLLNINTSDIIYSHDNIRMPCPIHKGDNPTAFVMDTETFSWHCFSNKCHEKYTRTMIGFIQGVLGYNFRDSVNWVVNNFGSDIKNSDFDSEKLIVKNLIRQIKRNDEHHDQRCSIPLDTITQSFKVSDFFKDLGFQTEVLKKFYVFDCYNKNKPMYLRACAPIISNDYKNMHGITGRTLLPKCELCNKYHVGKFGCPNDNPSIKSYPKWKHYGFSSKTVLYNFWNVYSIKPKTVVIVEGPKDVWWLDQHGVYNALGLFGLNISVYNIKQLLKLGVENIVLCTDNDERGSEAEYDLSKKLYKFFNIYKLSSIIDPGKDIADMPDDFIANEIHPVIKNIGG
ncbi:MAG: hypothetical protein BAJALOKI3v1_50096 [Promethearchaeota archaeon]|nr:MAG: hypothetical protein BAJALOKI3v1_50096 [Candidatus Lokiarchaeota archaeon]